MPAYASFVSVSVRVFGRSQQGNRFLECAAFLTNWLTYVNSALDWIFYAAMNRDLRTLIRNNTERRKRSTLKYPSPKLVRHQSLREYVSNSFRVLHDSHSVRSVHSCSEHGSSVAILAAFRSGNRNCLMPLQASSAVIITDSARTTEKSKRSSWNDSISSTQSSIHATEENEKFI
ncbi:hypothetical protein AB6A40_007202 [Gnathostoma spinigerum]|uniref:Uncharacterized protein n=1 Tax=Gnathostoma spinigerum TaxID=75299 RepID=A0ABD6EKT8_9BILA